MVLKRKREQEKMPKTVEIERSIVIDAPPSRVWDTSAKAFERISNWDGEVIGANKTDLVFYVQNHDGAH